jgi:beta-glucosidase
MIDKLLEKGIIPFVTLYHWDLPEDLETHHGGWLNADMVDKFLVYADICFKEFGDRVKYWLTFNEPHTFILHGYQTGLHAPGRCSNRLLCPFGNSTTEPYIAGHTVMRAHAYAVDLYRTNYYPKQKGKIGITLDASWIEPFDPKKPEDQAAAQRAMIWHLAWFGDPVYFGEYPKEMRERVGSRLPKFTEEEKELLKKSMDFFGLNHYWSSYAYHDDHPEGEGYFYDRGCYVTPERNGVFIGPQADSTWFWIYPKGMRGIINWVWKRYNHPEIFITENGVDVPHESYIPVQEALNDTFRIKFYEDYIGEMEKAVLEDGVKMGGYMAWSLLDNFEWADGNEKRFGMVYVDYKNKMDRYPKNSAYWYRDFIKYQTSSASEFVSEYHSNAKSLAHSLPKSEQMNHDGNKSEAQLKAHPEHHHNAHPDKPHPPQPELAAPQLQNAEAQSQAEPISSQ